MKVTSAFEFMFSAAVRLPGATGAKKHLHGHNYRLQVILDGEVDEAMVRQTVREAALERADHHMLNDVIPEPSAANVAKWFFAELKPKLPQLIEVALWPTAEHCVRVS